MPDNFAGKNVLVVDNSALMTRMIKSYLVKAGFQSDNISTATDGHQAFLLTELKDFDLITSGLHMRFLGGMQLLEIIRKSDEKRVREIPILLITAERREGLAQEFENAGGNGRLFKPFDKDILVDTMKKIFNHGGEGFVTAESAPDAIARAAGDLKFDPQVVSAFVESALEALSQYMVSATVGELIDGDDLKGDFISWIDLTDKETDTKLIIMLLFPKTVACDIYESIFGSVDMDEVCGVVQELCNIIAGICKPKLSDYCSEIYRLVHPDLADEVGDDIKINFQVGLPVAKMGENFYPKVFQQGVPKFTIPFTIGEEMITLQVSFQKS